MSYSIEFECLHLYDGASESITVPIVLSCADKKFALLACVDTGASCCIFPRGIGEALGIDVESGVEKIFATAIGDFATFGHFVSFGLEIDGSQIELDDKLVYFAKFPEFSRSVLGRDGWINQFTLGIEDYSCKLYLRRIS